MKFITSDAHCIKFSRLDQEKGEATLRFSWIGHAQYRLKIIGQTESGDLILEPILQGKEKVQYHVQPEDGQFKINEWLNVVTKVVTA